MIQWFLYNSKRSSGPLKHLWVPGKEILTYMLKTPLSIPLSWAPDISTCHPNISTCSPTGTDVMGPRISPSVPAKSLPPTHPSHPVAPPITQAGNLGLILDFFTLYIQSQGLVHTCLFLKPILFSPVSKLPPSPMELSLHSIQPWLLATHSPPTITVTFL